MRPQRLVHYREGVRGQNVLAGHGCQRTVSPFSRSRIRHWSGSRSSGRSAQEHLVASLRCLYQRAVEDGLITEAGKPGAEGGQAAPPTDHPAGAAGYPAGRDQPDGRGHGR